MRTMLRPLPLLLLLAPAAVFAEDPPPAVGVSESRDAGVGRVDAVVPGEVVATALPRGADGRRRIAILVAPESPKAAKGEEDGQEEGPEAWRNELPDGPRSLYLFDPAGKGSLRPVVQDLPAEADSLAALDLDGDGADEVLLGEPGKLSSLGSPERWLASPRRLLEEPTFSLREARGRTASLSSGGDLAGIPVSVLGKLLIYRPDGAGGLAAGSETPLPVRASRERSGLRLTSPRARMIAGRAGGAPLYAAGPEAAGKQRLRTLLIDPASAEPPVEAWSLLPAPEKVEDVWMTRIDGRPSLIVTTYQADKLGIFEKAKLRIFPLVADRTRGGRKPSLAVQTESRRWVALEPVIRDVDGDGKDDLVLIQQEGMGGGELVIETYFGRGSGGNVAFEPAPKRQKWELRAGRWSYGQDLTGDGRPDFAVLGGEKIRQLQVFAGAADPRKNGLLEKSPRLLFPRKTGQAAPSGALSIDDLDGDGHAEALLVDDDVRGRGRVTLLQLP